MLERLAALPPIALYLALAAAAAIENFFPPFPADTVVAFGSFLAARGEGSMLGTLLSTWAGNVAGAVGVYALGRRYGAASLETRLRRYGGGGAMQRLRALHARHGLLALFASRFIPGARALVPPFAGALRLPALPVITVIAVASAIWYGIVTVLAYRAGASWETLLAAIGRLSRTAALAAVVVVAILLAVWLLRRERRRP